MTECRTCGGEGVVGGLVVGESVVDEVCYRCGGTGREPDDATLAPVPAAVAAQADAIRSFGAAVYRPRIDSLVGPHRRVYDLVIRVDVDGEAAAAIPGAPGSMAPDGQDADAPVQGIDLVLGAVVEAAQSVVAPLLRAHRLDPIVTVGDEGGVKSVRVYQEFEREPFG